MHAAHVFIIIAYIFLYQTTTSTNTASPTLAPFSNSIVDDSVRQGGGPVVVAKAYDGEHATSVFAGMVPATKASSFGIGGHTHLVADKREEVWAVRQLHHVEVEAMFKMSGISATVSEYGNSAPAGMVIPRAKEVVDFMRPPSRFVPAAISDVVGDETVQVCRGWMDLASQDFDQLAKRK
jgi:hypothetical protein